MQKYQKMTSLVLLVVYFPISPERNRV